MDSSDRTGKMNSYSASSEVSAVSSDFQPNPKRQGVKSYPIETFVEVFHELKSIEATSLRLNVSYTTVLRYLRKAGVIELPVKPRKLVEHPLELFVQLRQKRLTLRQIAEKLNVSEKTVCKRLREAGYNNVGKVQAPRRELYLSLKKQGLSNEEIAKKCGVLTETVRQMLLNYSGGARETRRMQQIAKRYIQMYKNGMSMREIAQRCGKAYVTVARSLRLHGVTGKRGVLANKNELIVPSLSVNLPTYG